MRSADSHVCESGEQARVAPPSVMVPVGVEQSDVVPDWVDAAERYERELALRLRQGWLLWRLPEMEPGNRMPVLLHCPESGAPFCVAKLNKKKRIKMVVK